MFEIAKGRVIQLSAGDSGAVTIEIDDAQLSSADRGVFTLKKRNGSDVVMRKVIEPEENSFVIPFVHEETEKMEPGSYVWDFRIAFNAQLTPAGDVRGGDQVSTVIERGVLSVVRTVGEV